MGTGPNIFTQTTRTTQIIQYRHNGFAGFRKGFKNDGGVETVGKDILVRFTGYIYSKNNAIC
jgi:hypothetical protein